MSAGAVAREGLVRVAEELVVAGGVAAGHHPGDRGVASQPPARLWSQRFRPASLPAEATSVEEAVQLDHHGKLRADPTRLGQSPALEGAAGQLGEGVGVPLASFAGVAGVSRASQRLQRRHDDLASLGLQQPVNGDHALEGRGQPQPPPLVIAFGLGIGTIRIGHQQQMSDRATQLGRVQAAGRFQQQRFGLGGDMVGKILGTHCEHPSMRW